MGGMSSISSVTGKWDISLILITLGQVFSFFLSFFLRKKFKFNSFALQACDSCLL